MAFNHPENHQTGLSGDMQRASPPPGQNEPSENHQVHPLLDSARDLGVFDIELQNISLTNPPEGDGNHSSVETTRMLTSSSDGDQKSPASTTSQRLSPKAHPLRASRWWLYLFPELLSLVFTAMFWGKTCHL
jgi:hypothetical protein